MSSSAGRILLIPKGEYNSSTQYYSLDFVYYQGRSYVCKQASKGNAPTNTTYWQVMTEDYSSDIQTLSNVRAELGAHNLGKRFKDGVSSAGITIKDAPNGGNYVNNTATGSGGRLVLISDTFVLKAGTYSIVGESSDHSKYSSVVLQKASDNSVLGNYLISNGTVDKSQATVTLAADTECYFGFNTYSGTAYGTDTFIIYPMVKLADDKDDTFYPYSKPNTELTKDDIGLTANAFENGAVNLLENEASSVVTGDTTFTVNDNGTVKAVKTTAGTTIDQLFMNMSFPLKKGRYKLSGIPPTGTSGTNTYIRVTNAAFTVLFCTINSQHQTAEFSLDADTDCRIFLSLDKTYTTDSSGVEFRPMITVADMPNSDYAHYVPYAKSNKELTEDVEDLSNAQYFDFTTETSVYVNTSAQPMTHTIANDGTYRVSLTSKNVDAQNGATLLINGVTIGTVRADIMENNISRILKLKKGAVITNTNSGTARYRMDVIKLS